MVGYNKVTLTKGYNMLSPMFVNVGGGNKAIVDLFNEDDFTAGESSTEADYISLWYAGGYQDLYFFSTDANNAWSSDGFEETEDDLPENVGFWLYNRGGERTVTLSGEVPTEDVTITLTVGYNLLANPFSAPLPVSSIVPTQGNTLKSGESSTEADYISVWRNGGYDSLYFVSSDAGDTWSEDGFEETDATIAPGEAFWLYRRDSAAEIKIPAPYAL